MIIYIRDKLILGFRVPLIHMQPSETKIYLIQNQFSDGLARFYIGT